MADLEKIYIEFQELVARNFPEFRTTRSGYGGTHFHIEFPDQPRFYKETPYYYTSEKRFIHWTNLWNLSSILNSREFRLYNLINSEDPDEFNFAVSALKLSPEQREYIKENYFTFSFCQASELYNRELWQTYGDEFKGVAIEFSVLNSIDDWENHVLSKVYYELNDKFRSFQEEVNHMEAKYSDQIELQFDIWKLAGFHKMNAYQSEKEIRIASCFPMKNAEENLKVPRTEFKIGGRGNRIVRYIPLKLWINTESLYPKDFYPGEDYAEHVKGMLSGKPHIKLENFYFGPNCGLTNDEYPEYRAALQRMVHFQLGYLIQPPMNLFDIDDPSLQNN